ncbi:L-serine dehydratase/L-threonine deaminase-like [Saccoglossus kowalevskii]|uniref:L-serine ammonia-lyase n=1 Tax=Saccoglossus kowalevskii TaxID=10224 RepID=A0ABM0GUN4_SACKO|nr:PREDICTED: serine dehydratase-like [Saccoglossus kowalevskii]
MDTNTEGALPLHIHTPLVHSRPMSLASGLQIYLKCENLQPTDTFKIRGIANLCSKAKSNGCTRVICSSGGNAGVAAAYAARKLGLNASIIVPESTPQFTVDRLRTELGATVEVHGKVWNLSEQHALKLAEEPGCAYVPPFEHPDIWAGHATVIEEIAQDLKEKPDVIILSVGGGGLLNGVVQGLRQVGWDDVPVVAMETVGADCFNQAVKSGHLVTLPDITSVAKCLGALTVSQTSLDYHRKHQIHSVVVEDKEAISACLRFLDDHRMMVEPACGAALAGIYSNVIPDLQKGGKLKNDVRNIVIVVCGGSNVTLKQLVDWKEQFGL